MNKFISLILVGMLFFACSNGEQPLNLQDGLVFKISTQNPLDLRVAGELYSQEAKQDVERVMVYAFREDGGDYLYEDAYDIPWTPGSTSTTYTVPENDPLIEELPAGTYKFIAVGRDADPDGYEILPASLSNTVKFEDMLAAIQDSESALSSVYELFAGVDPDKTLTEAGGSANITMTRKVAGILGYFTNVPKNAGNPSQEVTSIRLKASAANLNVNLSTSAGSEPATLSDGYFIINIDLSGATTTTVSGLGDIYNSIDVAPVVTLPYSQLDGAYLLPINGITLRLGLYNGDTELIGWDVVDGASTAIDIIANNFYSLGTKTKESTTTGADGIDDSGDGDDDKGIDISDLVLHDVIMVTVSPNWGPIHNLTLQ